MHVFTGRPAHVQLAGGEPTLRPPPLSTSPSVLWKFGGKGHRGIQTSLVRPDGDIIAMLKRHSVRVGVSVDGPPQCTARRAVRAAQTFRPARPRSRRHPGAGDNMLSALNVEHLDELAALATLPNVTGFARPACGNRERNRARRSRALQRGRHRRITTLYRRLAHQRAARHVPALAGVGDQGLTCRGPVLHDQRRRLLRAALCSLWRTTPTAMRRSGNQWRSQSVAASTPVQAVGDMASASITGLKLRRRFSQDRHTLRGPCHRCALVDDAPAVAHLRVEANALADSNSRLPHSASSTALSPVWKVHHDHPELFLGHRRRTHSSSAVTFVATHS